MTGLLIRTGLAIEARAVRRGLAPSGGEVRVMRTGPGPRRAARAAAAAPGQDVLAVVGFCGALDEGLRAGDVLVASEVRFGGRVLPCPLAPPLAREVARAGLPVFIGPLVTCDHVVRGAERHRLAAEGMRAADMETGPAAMAMVAAGRPWAAVRVVVDTPAAPLLSMATVRGGLAARRALRRVAPALTRWAASLAKEAPP